jgi:hypothetical protein
VEATIEKSVICGVKKKKSFSFLKNKKLRSDFKKIKLSKKIYIYWEVGPQDGSSSHRERPSQPQFSFFFV